MFIKLTKIDGTPVWIRAALVVTVEPDRQGGSVVVPLGDGLDYEVREKPEEVLAMLEEPASMPRVPEPQAEVPPAASSSSLGHNPALPEYPVQDIEAALNVEAKAQGPARSHPPRRRRNPEAGQKRKSQPGPSNEPRTA